MTEPTVAPCVVPEPVAVCDGIGEEFANALSAPCA